MEPAKTFEDLIVWQKAHQFVFSVYSYAQTFPKGEVYALVSQFRRAAISVAANIAEGFKNRGKKDKRKFLNTAQSSLEECRYYILLCKDLNYGENQHLKSLAEEVSRILDSCYNSVMSSTRLSFLSLVAYSFILNSLFFHSS
jgi:four helix bundle protein